MSSRKRKIIEIDSEESEEEETSSSEQESSEEETGSDSDVEVANSTNTNTNTNTKETASTSSETAWRTIFLKTPAKKTAAKSKSTYDKTKPPCYAVLPNCYIHFGDIGDWKYTITGLTGKGSTLTSVDELVKNMTILKSKQLAAIAKNYKSRMTFDRFKSGFKQWDAVQFNVRFHTEVKTTLRELDAAITTAIASGKFQHVLPNGPNKKKRGRPSVSTGDVVENIGATPSRKRRRTSKRPASQQPETDLLEPCYDINQDIEMRLATMKSDTNVDATLQSLNEALMTATNNLRSEKAELRGENADLKRRIAELEANCAVHAAQAESFRDKYDEVRYSLYSANRAIKRLCVQIEELRKRAVPKNRTDEPHRRTEYDRVARFAKLVEDHAAPPLLERTVLQNVTIVNPIKKIINAH